MSWRTQTCPPSRESVAVTHAMLARVRACHTLNGESNIMQIRDRVKELRRVRASELVPSARNWRTHPDAQRDALRGVLAEVGYAGALLVRELPDGRLELVDGHLRAETTPDALVPVLVLDVNEEEAVKIMLTHDPLAALAGADLEKLSDLLGDCDIKNPQVMRMLADLEDSVREAEEALAESHDTPEVPIPEAYQVVVECADEAEQEKLYERLREEGYRCRVLTL